ncbi:MAG: hypothetical protein HY815_22200 [Candidatus Riflebacteria bacterium]|nr:hypothetical protein [Candidatus Riflebacteria bacterium]
MRKTNSSVCTFAFLLVAFVATVCPAPADESPSIRTSSSVIARSEPVRSTDWWRSEAPGDRAPRAIAPAALPPTSLGAQPVTTVAAATAPAKVEFSKKSGPGSERTEVDVAVEAGGIGTSGNQLNVREYDRRAYRNGDLRHLAVRHFGKEGVFQFRLSNPFTWNWQDAGLDLRTQEVHFRYDLSCMTHNLSSERQNMIINGVRRVIQPATGATFSTAGEGSWEPNMNRRDLNLGYEFYLNRQAHDLELLVGQPMDKRLRLGLWLEHDYGRPEQWRAAPEYFGSTGFSQIEHPQTGFLHPTNRLTREIEVGGDARVKNGSVHATYFHMKQDDDTPEIPFTMKAGGSNDRRPSLINFPEKTAHGFRGGFTVPIKDKARFTVNHVARDRHSDWNGYDLDTDTFTAAFDWEIGRDWAINSKLRDYSRRTRRNEAYQPTDSLPGLGVGGGPYVFQDPRQGIYDEKSDEFELSVQFDGLKNHHVTAGFRSEAWTRPNDYRTRNSLIKYTNRRGNGIDERLLFVHEANARTGGWVSVNGAPDRKLSYRVKVQKYDANRDDFTRGSALDEREWTGNVSYDFRPTLTGYVDVANRRNDSSNEPYFEYFKNFTVGAFGLAGKWGVGAHYTRENFDTTYLLNWQQRVSQGSPPTRRIGVRPFATNGEYVKNTADVYSLTLTPPRIGDRCQTEVTYCRTNSWGFQSSAAYNVPMATGGLPGASIATPIDLFILGQSFAEPNAIDVGIDRLTLKADFDLCKKAEKKTDHQIGIEYTHGRWADAIDSSQTGRFDLAWLTYRRRL